MAQTIEVHVIDQFDNPVLCSVKIPDAVAPDTRSTCSDGKVSFELNKDKWYTASVQPLSGYTLLPEESDASFPFGTSSVNLRVTKGAVSSLKNIPPEISAIMPSGTTRILIMNLKPLSWANFSGLKSDIPWLVEKVASIITVGGFIGWECLGVDVVKTSDNKTLMPIFLRRS